jgi:hypothetical protein
MLSTEESIRRHLQAGYHREGRIKIDARWIVHGAPDGWFKPGAGKTEWFKDHEHGPEMVVVPGGGFMMGSPDTEQGRLSVWKGRSTQVGRHERPPMRPLPGPPMSRCRRTAARPWDNAGCGKVVGDERVA